VVTIKPDRLTVRLNWHGRVLDGPLRKRVKAGDACWSIDATHVNIGRIKANSLNMRMAQQAASQAAAAVATKAGTAEGCSGEKPGANAKARDVADTGACRAGSDGDSSRAAHASQMSGTSESEMSELLVILPKEEEGRYWRALFEGGEEKSHIQVRRCAHHVGGNR
jgi:hypothetical protein